MNIRKLFFRAVALSITIVYVSTGSVGAALLPEQRAVFSSGNIYFDVEEAAICTANRQDSGTFIADGSNVTFIGDSLTVGMRDFGGLSDLITAAGWNPQAIIAKGGEDIQWGISQVEDNSLDIRNSNVVVVGLGTNHVGDVVRGDEVVEGAEETLKQRVVTMVEAIKNINPDAEIYWTNVYITGELSTEYGTFNMDTARTIINNAIAEGARETGINIVDYEFSDTAREIVTNDGTGSNDGIHPYGDYPLMAETVVDYLRGQSRPELNAATCTCSINGLTGGNSGERIFNYFTGTRGLSPAIAAGIVGNMMNESGDGEDPGSINPQRLQGVFNREVGAEEALTFATQSAKAWGIVQWDPNSKIIQTARDAGISFEEIGTLEFQLDFLWHQLIGEGWRGNPDNLSNEKSAGDDIFAATTVEEAAFLFGYRYERFRNSRDTSNPEHLERIDDAVAFLNNTTPSNPTNVTCNEGLSAGANGWDLPSEGPNPMIYYSQRTSGQDPAVTGYYGNQPYGPGRIAHCGCGPTAWASIVHTLTGQQTTPDVVAEWSTSNGFQQSSTGECGGSNWWWSDNAPLSQEKWGVSATRLDVARPEEWAAALRRGSLIMVSAGEGPFTSGGHLLVMRAITEDGKFLFADPNDYNDTRSLAQDVFNGESKSRTALSPEQFAGSLKGLWEIQAL